MVKYKLPVSNVKPFVEVGLAPRSITGTISDSGVSVNLMTGQLTPFSGSSKTNWSNSMGVVTGGGVQLSIGRVSPEVSYTHWTSTPINGSFADGPPYSSTQEQVDVSVGIGWKIR